MPLTFEQSKDAIAQLVKHFATNREAYRAPAYKEAHARQEFIDPLFLALGWDVHNTQRAAPDYREVVMEDTLEIAGQKKAPDYVFRVGKDRKFFVEAKKPGVDLKQDAQPAYQLRRYAWTAKLPLSILTDFEEMAVYDCRARPAPTDKASAGRLLYFTFQEYPDRWQEIWDVFSRQAVLGGSFDQYAQASKGKRGTSTVDSEFLKEIEGWRDALARNLALRNPRLSIDDLNDAVQRTIDRIIFLRMAEDRGIEEYERLRRLADGGEGDNIYGGLVTLFRHADARYNSGLFDFSRAGDQLTPGLKIDDKTLKPILTSLYFPESPYEFSVLPVEILGNVYEQFLGRVIKLTEGHRAKVEEKPEVRKAGGVHYTPAYIVEYIVKNTVGKLIAGKSPQQLKGFRILDPACGSGSFLLGAYQFLLDYYLSWYIANDPEKHRRAVWWAGEVWRLTTAERKRILLEHIYGVDIDRQAVEVTKLSLLLKVLETETSESLGHQLTLLHEEAKERALPNLDRNIKCGNSLIGPDYFSGQLIPNDDELRRVNPFDWAKEFPEAMRAGGFDCVIGNPPYIRIQMMKEWASLEVEIYKQIFAAASSGNYDVYVVFVEKGLSLLKENGQLGFIVPNKFFQAQYGQSIREVISNGKYLERVVHFGSHQIFSGATTYTCLLFLNKEGKESFEFTRVSKLADWIAGKPQSSGYLPSSLASEGEWNFVVDRTSPILDRMSKLPLKLSDVAARVFQGIIPGADKVYTVELLRTKGEKAVCYSRALEMEIEIEASLLKNIVSGAEVKRYVLSQAPMRVIFPYKFDANGECHLIDSSEMADKYPLALSYFRDARKFLDVRDRGSAKGSEWYRYIRTQNICLQKQAKLAVPRLVSRLCCGYDSSGLYCLDNVDVGGIILSEKVSLSPLYVMGLLNSKLLDLYFKSQSVPFRGSYFSANRQYIERLPIRPINFSDPADKTRHDLMVKLVEQMLDLHKRLAASQSTGERERLQRLIDSTDQQIDALVYELYGLTPEEIAIVEERAA